MIGLGSTITPGSSGWEYILSPMRMRDPVIAATGDVVVELAPEGPQRGDLASDIAAALEANLDAAAFFDRLAQFYRKAYLRWIDATTRRPDLRAARIAEVVDLLAAGIKQRPRSPRQSTPRVGRRAGPRAPGGATSPHATPQAPDLRRSSGAAGPIAASPGALPVQASHDRGGEERLMTQRRRVVSCSICDSFSGLRTAYSPVMRPSSMRTARTVSTSPSRRRISAG